MRSGVWRRVGVHEDDCLATLQFFEDRLQPGIAQVHAVGVREQRDTIELENVERVRQLAQRRINVWQWQTGETRKPVWPHTPEFGREFIAAARERPRFDAVSRVHSGRTQRHDRDVDAGVIHERNADVRATREDAPGRRLERARSRSPARRSQAACDGATVKSVSSRAAMGDQAWSPRISCAARPAIMCVGAFVGPVIIRGITEASATSRKPCAAFASRRM